MTRQRPGESSWREEAVGMVMVVVVVAINFTSATLDMNNRLSYPCGASNGSGCSASPPAAAIAARSACAKSSIARCPPPNCCASRRATVVLPAPLGPHTPMTSGRSQGRRAAREGSGRVACTAATWAQGAGMEDSVEPWTQLPRGEGFGFGRGEELEALFGRGLGLEELFGRGLGLEALTWRSRPAAARSTRRQARRGRESRAWSRT